EGLLCGRRGSAIPSVHALLWEKTSRLLGGDDQLGGGYPPCACRKPLIASAQVVNPGGPPSSPRPCASGPSRSSRSPSRGAFGQNITNSRRRADMPMIDIYTHIFGERFYAEMSKGGGSLGSFAERFARSPAVLRRHGHVRGTRRAQGRAGLLRRSCSPPMRPGADPRDHRRRAQPRTARGCQRADLLKQRQEAAELVADRLPARPLARTICILRRGFATAHCDDAAEASAGRPKEAQHV